MYTDVVDSLLTITVGIIKSFINASSCEPDIHILRTPPGYSANPPVGPSNITVAAFLEENKNGELKPPRALTIEEIKVIISQFKDAARRAVKASFDTIEIHDAHGYLLHQFQSPAINNREDEYVQNLSKFGVEVIQTIRSVISDDMPLIMGISATLLICSIEFVMMILQKYFHIIYCA